MLEPQTGFLCPWQPFPKLVDFGFHLIKHKTWWCPGPHSHLESVCWRWRALSPMHQGLPQVPTRFHYLQASQLCISGSDPRTLLPCPRSHITNSGSWEQDHSGHFPGRPNSGNGEVLSAFARLQVELRKIRRQVSPAARKFEFWAYIPSSQDWQTWRAVSSFPTQPFVFNQCLYIGYCKSRTGYAWCIQLPKAFLLEDFSSVLKAWMWTQIQSMFCSEKRALCSFLIWPKNLIEFKRYWQDN